MKDTAQNTPPTPESQQQPQAEPPVEPQILQNTKYKYKGFAIVGVIVVALILVL